jgi:hypothetical protein
MGIHREETLSMNPSSTPPPPTPSPGVILILMLLWPAAGLLPSTSRQLWLQPRDDSWFFCILAIVWSTEYIYWWRWNRVSVSVHSAGAYTATLYVMVTIVKGGGRAPPPPHQPWLIFPSESGGCHSVSTLWYDVRERGRDQWPTFWSQI